MGLLPRCTTSKIAIPESILNKPSKLTYDEFEMIKTHALIGADMLKNLPLRQQEPLVKVAYQICRWHHERYDGKGYPDGLVGDEIPISAQVVALADVYDALTSRRVYKEAYTHERALKMIFDGECGSFNPLLLECLKEASDTIQNELKINSLSAINKKQMRNVANEMLQHEELSASERTLRLLEHERTKYQFFASMSNEIQFEYMLFPSMLSVSEWGAKQLGINEFVINPCKDKAIKALFKSGDLARLANALKKTTPTTPVIQGIYQLKIRDEVRWYKLIARSMWSSEEAPKYVGAIGKLVDVNDEQMKISTLEKLALQDALTGLYNQETVKKKIEAELKENPDAPYAMIIIDLDRFKSANDNFGHLFGNGILRYVARQIRDNLRPGELAARVGGDEFVVFVRGQKELEERIQHFFDVLSENRDNYKISVSMGVSLRGERNGSYEKLFHEADQALYVSKRAGRGMYRFYNKKMKDLFSAISPIDDEKAAEGNEEK
ncbi:MAG: diguanylate cyclase domain-containing protein [Christensenellaceae bacterium]